MSSRDQHPTRIRAKAGRGEGRIEFQSVSGDLSLTTLDRFRALGSGAGLPAGVSPLERGRRADLWSRVEADHR